MKGPKASSIAHKKLDSEMMKKRKAGANAKKEKASKKNSGAPKRPPSAFFVFMEDFRKTFKENFPYNKAVSAVRYKALL
ncbi:HMG1/2-like protein [Sarracenia purpurea var. burkii]